MTTRAMLNELIAFLQELVNVLPSTVLGNNFATLSEWLRDMEEEPVEFNLTPCPTCGNIGISFDLRRSKDMPSPIDGSALWVATLTCPTCDRNASVCSRDAYRAMEKTCKDFYRPEE